MPDEPHLSPELTDAALRVSGLHPENWLCPVCGAVIRDDLLAPGFTRPPFHRHHDRPIALIPRAEL